MAIFIGTVREINGNYFIKKADGATETMKVGDQVYSDDFVYGDTTNTYYDNIFITLDESRIDVLLVKNESQRFDAILNSEVEIALKEMDAYVELEDTAAGEEISTPNSTGISTSIFAIHQGSVVDIRAFLNDMQSEENNADTTNPFEATIGGGAENVPNAEPIVPRATIAVLEDNTVSGTVAATDIDGFIASVVVDGTAPTGLTLNNTGSYTFDASSYDTLAEGEEQIIEVPITVTDNEGAATSTTLTITLTGTNDAPVASAAVTHNLDEDDGIITGQVTATDIDDHAAATFAISNDATAPAGFTLDSDGNWDFDPSDAAYDYLNIGEVQTLIIPVTVTDEHGATEETTITINVAGNSDEHLVAHWEFTNTDDTATAGIKDDNGVLQGDAQITNNNTLMLDGTSSWMDIDNSNDINLGTHAQRSIIFSFRADPDGTDGKQVIYEEGAGARGLNIYLDNGNIGIGGWNNPDSESDWNGTWLNSTVNVKDGQWHQVTLVLDGTGNDADSTDTDGSLTGYIDGVAFGQGSASQLWSHGGDINIGTSSDTLINNSALSNAYFQGEIAEGKIYDYALNDTQAATLFTNTIFPASTPFPVDTPEDHVVSHWDFRGDTTDTAVVGNVTDDGTLKGDAYITDRGTLILDGNGDWMQMVNSSDINLGTHPERTITFSFNTSESSGKQVIYEEGATVRGLNIYVDDGKIGIGGWNKHESGWGGDWITSTTDVSDGKWHQVTLVLAAVAGSNAIDGKLYGYIDGGEPFAEVSASQLWSHSGDIKIGDSTDTLIYDQIVNHAYFLGEIAEAKIYDIAMTQEEVQYTYDHTLVNDLIGTAGDESLTGTDENDYIDGKEGHDTIDAAEGNDFILFDHSDTSIDGGDGFDTLAISDPFIDFATISDHVREIEEIRFEGNDQEIKLHADDIVQMTDSSDTMRFTTDTNGTLQLSLTNDGEAQEWEKDESVTFTENDHTYDVYISVHDSSVQLHVDQMIIIEDF